MKMKKGYDTVKKVEIAQETSDGAVNLAIDTIRNGKQALIFNNTKRSAEKTAEEIAKRMSIMPELADISERMLNSLSRPTKQCKRLAFCTARGIAFHHSGLLPKQREMIEEMFRKGTIKIISATPTLAAGVDLPAFRSIIKDVRRFSHFGGLSYIPVLEFLQMAGRAGRPKYDKYGEAIMIATTEAEKERLYDIYINGEPEPIHSKLAVEPVLRTYLLSLIASDILKSKNRIMDFFSRTFWAFQFENMPMLENIIIKMLRMLEDFGFIIRCSFRSALEEMDGDIKYEATPIGKRVSELYIDPITANEFIHCLKRATTKITSPFSYLLMVSNTVEMHPLLKARTKDYDTINECLIKNSDTLISLEPNCFDIEYEEFLASVKTAMFLNDWIEEDDEEDLLEKYDIRPGEIRVKLEIAEWLLYSAIELAKILNLRKQANEATKIRVRVLYGAREELIPLLQLENIGRVRARRLFRNGYKDLGDLKKADIVTLSQILGNIVARNIKEQLGQHTESISKKTRIGQTSVTRYEKKTP